MVHVPCAIEKNVFSCLGMYKYQLVGSNFCNLPFCSTATSVELWIVSEILVLIWILSQVENPSSQSYLVSLRRGQCHHLYCFCNKGTRPIEPLQEKASLSRKLEQRVVERCEKSTPFPILIASHQICSSGLKAYISWVLNLISLTKDRKEIGSYFNSKSCVVWLVIQNQLGKMIE